MNEYKDSMYEIAKGNIENPTITLGTGDEEMIFEGHNARIFATGVLVGLKSKDGAVKVDIDLNKSAT